jgi:hypothetical protein
MIKTYELINGTLKEVVHSDEPKVELKYFIHLKKGKVKPEYSPREYSTIRVIGKKFDDGLDLIEAVLTPEMTKHLYLGTYNEPAELKGIEVVNIMTEGGIWILRRDILPVTGDYSVTLIDRNYCNDLDLFVKDTDGIKVLCLGHWNDGIVK